MKTSEGAAELGRSVGEAVPRGLGGAGAGGEKNK